MLFNSAKATVGLFRWNSGSGLPPKPECAASTGIPALARWDSWCCYLFSPVWEIMGSLICPKSHTSWWGWDLIQHHKSCFQPLPDFDVWSPAWCTLVFSGVLLFWSPTYCFKENWRCLLPHPKIPFFSHSPSVTVVDGRSQIVLLSLYTHSPAQWFAYNTCEWMDGWMHTFIHAYIN